MLSVILANTLFLFFKDTTESVNGIKNSKGNNSAELPGKSFQIKGLPSIINEHSRAKINSVIIDIIFNILLLFFIILLISAFDLAEKLTLSKIFIFYLMTAN